MHAFETVFACVCEFSHRFVKAPQRFFERFLYDMFNQTIFSMSLENSRMHYFDLLGSFLQVQKPQTYHSRFFL